MRGDRLLDLRLVLLHRRSLGAGALVRRFRTLSRLLHSRLPRPHVDPNDLEQREDQKLAKESNRQHGAGEEEERWSRR